MSETHPGKRAGSDHRAFAWVAICLGCSSTPTVAADGGPMDVGPTMPITLLFAAVVGTAPFSCASTYPGLGTTRTTYTPTDFRLYVSNFRAVTASGAEVPLILREDGRWQHAGVALLDFENGMGNCAAGTPPMNNQVIADVPVGTYAGLRFQVGLPFDLDHADVSVAPPPLDVGGLYWSWATGYRFLRIDGNTTGLPQGFLIHLGSTGCPVAPTGLVAGPCAGPNLVDVNLAAFDPVHQTIAIDLAALTAGTNLDVSPPDAPAGCQSDPMNPRCVSIFALLGLSYDGVAPPGPQGFVTAR